MKTVTLENTIKKITVGIQGPTGATGETGPTGPAFDLDGATETEATADATAGGTVTLDASVANVYVVTADDTAFTLAVSNLPASGDSQGLTILFLFTGATLPTITWPTLGTAANAQTAPDLSDASVTTGWAVCTVAEINGDTFAWKVSAQ